MLICEKLYLLLTKDDGRSETMLGAPGFGLNAAVIVDLVEAGRLELTDDKFPRIKMLGSEALTNPILAEANALLQRKEGKRLDSVLATRSLCNIQLVTDSLVRAGIVEYGERSFFGFGKERAITIDAQAERQLRADLRAVLHRQKSPNVSESALLTILQGLETISKVLPVEIDPMDRKQAKERIKEIELESKTGEAVSRAVAAMNASLMALMVVQTTTINMP